MSQGDEEDGKSGKAEEQAWKKVMESNAMKAAKRISMQLAGGEKKGFDDLDASARVAVEGLQAIADVKGEVVDLVSEQFIRLGGLTMRKMGRLADEIARARVENFFRQNSLHGFGSW